MGGMSKTERAPQRATASRAPTETEARGERRRKAEEAAAFSKAKRAEASRNEDTKRTNRVGHTEAAATERGMRKAERDAIAKTASKPAKDARRAVLEAKHAPL